MPLPRHNCQNVEVEISECLHGACDWAAAMRGDWDLAAHWTIIIRTSDLVNVFAEYRPDLSRGTP
jgi:hypothetical protein